MRKTYCLICFYYDDDDVSLVLNYRMLTTTRRNI